MAAPTFTPGRRRSFSHLNRSWYGDVARLVDEVDSIAIMLGEENGGVDYEFKITWTELAGTVMPRVDVFGSSWLAFAECADLFAWLASIDGNPSPWDVCDGLVALGFEDTTKTERRS